MRIRSLLFRLGIGSENQPFQKLRTEVPLSDYEPEESESRIRKDPGSADAKDQSSSHEEWQNRKVMLFLYAIAVIEGLDISLLPASFKAMESQSGLSPSRLGALAMSQALFQATAAMVWGSLADRGVSRKKLLSFGALGWGILTILMGAVYDFWFLFILRCLNGIALASLTPLCQSILSDAASPANRGVAFGFIQFSIQFGQGLSAFSVASVSRQEIWIAGVEVPGWRLAFGAVGVLSMLLSSAVAVAMPEPRRNENWEADKAEKPTKAGGWRLLEAMSEECRLLGSYFGIPSFVVIVVQGAFGMIPWHAMSFMILWLQYLGLSDMSAGAVSMCLTFSCGAGGVIGGCVGDRLTRWSRYHGRPLAAQTSVLLGIVAFVAILFGVPPELRSFWVFAGLCTAFGLTASWAGVGCNQPLLLELVAEGSRARILALLTAVNGALSAMLGGPVVGMLAEGMGYRVPERGVAIAGMGAEQRESNLQALTWALVLATLPPWGLCLATFSGLHCTYRRDALRAAAAESAHQ